MSQQSTRINITKKFWLIFLKTSIIVAPLLSAAVIFQMSPPGLFDKAVDVATSERSLGHEF